MKVSVDVNLLTNKQYSQILKKYIDIESSNYDNGIIQFIKENDQYVLHLKSIHANFKDKSIAKLIKNINRVYIQDSVIDNIKISVPLKVSLSQIKNSIIYKTQVQSISSCIFQMCKFLQTKNIQVTNSQTTFIQCKILNKEQKLKISSNKDSSIITFDTCEIKYKQLQLDTSQEFTQFKQCVINGQDITGLQVNIDLTQEQMIDSGDVGAYSTKFAFRKKPIKKTSKSWGYYIPIQTDDDGDGDGDATISQAIKKDDKKVVVKKKQQSQAQKLQKLIKKTIKTQLANIFYILYKKRNTWTKSR